MMVPSLTHYPFHRIRTFTMEDGISSIYYLARWTAQSARQTFRATIGALFKMKLCLGVWVKTL